MKNPGESVRANEAVVQLGNLYKLCADAYVPLDFAFRVKEGQVVEIQPRITQGKGEPLPDREEAIPGQDHVRRSPDPAGGRDGGPDPRRVRKSRRRAAAGIDGADDDLPEPARSRRPALTGAAPTRRPGRDNPLMHLDGTGEGGAARAVSHRDTATRPGDSG